MSIAQNVAQVRERMAAAARRAKRAPEEITLMAVSKAVEPERIRQAYETDVRVFGENRVQEFEDKTAAVAGLGGCEWHLIGHLQSNKANKAAELFDGIDSVDSLRLAEKLNAAATQLNRPLKVLIEINIGGEAAKSGVALNSAEQEQILRAAPQLTALHISGLMAIPPFTQNPEDARPYFRQLRELRDQIVQRKLPRVQMAVLSMGMSHDFEVAIEEGSTRVRIGTAIFGPR
ncbi:MAG: YggS family pyridoxal phosphate-dependent enzyme [Acidobacteriales bacterium]|nr:YggS family pyridoxal phosphate-dependent enzyme [Terriglobales bacterium]